MNILAQLKERVTQYLNVYVKLFKVNFIGKTAGVFSYLLFALVCLLIFFCIILFVGFGLTEVFIEAGLSKMVSFFVVIGIYVLLLVGVIGFRRSITRFFASGIIQALTEGDDEAEDEK